MNGHNDRDKREKLIIFYNYKVLALTANHSAVTVRKYDQY
jgi:hypothetical protein